MSEKPDPYPEGLQPRREIREGSRERLKRLCTCLSCRRIYTLVMVLRALLCQTITIDDFLNLTVNTDLSSPYQPLLLNRLQAWSRHIHLCDQTTALPKKKWYTCIYPCISTGNVQQKSTHSAFLHMDRILQCKRHGKGCVCVWTQL